MTTDPVPVHRLVKVGITQHVFIDPRTKRPTTVEVEKFYDFRHPARFYIRAVGDTHFEAQFSTTREATSVERLEPLAPGQRTLGRPAGVHDPAPDPAPTVRWTGQLRRPMSSAHASTTFE